MTRNLTIIFIVQIFRIHAQTANFNYVKSYDKYFDSLTFVVNGIKLESGHGVYKIKLHKDLDSVFVDNKWTGESYYVLSKFKENMTYDFTFNACSTYEIVPRKKTEGTDFIRLVSTNRNGTNLFLNSPYCFVDKKQIQSKDTTDYYIVASSGYCPYSVTSFNMCDVDWEDSNSKPSEYVGVVLYCKGGQMYTLSYDYSSKKMTVKFDGYYNRKLKIKIGDLKE